MVLVNTDAASTAARALATCAMLGMVALGSRGFATLTVHGGVGSGVGMWHEFWMGSPLGITYPEACPAPRDWSPRPTHVPTSKRTVQRPRSQSSKSGFGSYGLGLTFSASGGIFSRSSCARPGGRHRLWLPAGRHSPRASPQYPSSATLCMGDGTGVVHSTRCTANWRMLRWCVDFLNRRWGGPRDHYKWWKSVNRLHDYLWGVSKHSFGMQVIDISSTCDCLDSVDMAYLELLMRKARLMEFSSSPGEPSPPRKGDCNKKDKGTEKSRMGLYGEASIFLGSQKEIGEIMVGADFLDSAAKEVERVTGEVKQIRKAREERSLLSGDS